MATRAAAGQSLNHPDDAVIDLVGQPTILPFADDREEVLRDWISTEWSW